jgi:hypothetical protein
MDLTPAFIQQYYNIGCHLGKQPTLFDTVRSFPNTNPYQIFLSGPQNSNISVKEDDIQKTD